MNKAVKHKKESKESPCNICNNYNKLTFDHIPPKACINIIPIKIYHSPDRKQDNYLISQNGLKFKSICSKCNNARLGKLFDSELSILVNNIKKFAELKKNNIIITPDIFSFNIMPQRIGRAVIGHILSSLPPENLTKNAHISLMQKYFMNYNEYLDNSIEIYYWFYPYKDDIRLAWFSFPINLSSKELLFNYLLKFYPIAFLIIYSKPEGIRVNLNKLQI